MAGAVKMTWNAEPYRAKVQADLKRKLTASSIVVTTHAKRLISISGTGMFKEDLDAIDAGGKAKRRKGLSDLHWTEVKNLVQSGKVVKSRQGTKAGKVYGAFPSRPGEPPHKQTGHLRRSVTYEVYATTARVGTNIPYGRILELGGKNLAARPWLRRALIERRRQINDIFSKRI